MAAQRGLLLVVPELEQEVRSVLDGLDPDSREVFEEKWRTHVIDPGLLRSFDLPISIMIIQNREDVEAFSAVVEALAGPWW